MKTTKEQRRRIVQALRLGVQAERTTQSKRRRIVEVLRAEAGLPPKDWSRRPSGKPVPIDTRELDVERARLVAWHRNRAREYSARGLRRDRDGVHCKACGKTVVPGERLPVCVTPTALAVGHSYECPAWEP